MAQLCQHANDLKQLGVEVLLVSFSSQGYARTWVEEVCPAFHLLLDRRRESYRLYGLGESLLRSWSPKVVASYVDLMRRGRSWQGIRGHSTQLGGDFIVGPGGIVRLAYRSRDPTDRPSVDLLLSALGSVSPEKAAR